MLLSLPRPPNDDPPMRIEKNPHRPVPIGRADGLVNRRLPKLVGSLADHDIDGFASLAAGAASKKLNRVLVRMAVGERRERPRRAPAIVPTTDWNHGDLWANCSHEVFVGTAARGMVADPEDVPPLKKSFRKAIR